MALGLERASLSLSFIDCEEEVSVVTLYFAAPDLSGDAATAGANIQSLNSDMDDAKAAIVAMTQCGLVQEQRCYNMQHEIDRGAVIPEQTTGIQREEKLKIELLDKTTGRYKSFTIPAPVFDQLVRPDNGVGPLFWPLADNEMVALALALDDTIVVGETYNHYCAVTGSKVIQTRG